MPALDFKPLQHPGLILNREELAAVREKAQTVPWAQKALSHLIAEANRWLVQKPAIPDRKGQWMHFYACTDDGTSLETLSDTQHRCPTCGKVYTGEPYDSVVIRNRHMDITHAAIDLGLAYHLTGQQKYGDEARRIVLDYADRYLKYPMIDKDGKENDRGTGRVFCTILNESNWLTHMSWAYDLIAADLTETERKLACTDMLLPAARIVRSNRSRIHNIHCWMNSAMGCAAICCGDGDLAYDAIRAEYGLLDQLERGILDDGFWFECSWGYHFYTMEAVWPLVEAARHIGIDAYTSRYKTFFDAPLDFAFPGLTLPPLNDSGRGFFPIISRTAPYEIACARWRDPRHAGLLRHTDRTHRLSLCFGEAHLEAEPPEKTISVNFPASGVAILRDGTEDPAIVTLDYGPHGGGHGHPDKLGIIFYGAGRELAPDPGSIQYSVPLHLEWFKTTLSHNTVLVDQQPQQPCTGQLHIFDIRQGLRIASASADDAYPGVRFKRTIALLDGGLVLDLCELHSDREHTFDWAYHNRGALSSPLPLKSLGKPLGQTHGYQHMYDPASTRTDQAWTARWTLDSAFVALAQTGAPGAEIIAGTCPGNPASEPLGMVIARQRGKRALYASALSVCRDRAPELSLTVDLTDKTAHFRLTLDGQTHTIDLPR